MNKNKKGSNINWDDINWEKSYNAIRAYCQSKLANALFASELARRLEGTGVSTFYLHPGAVRTGNYILNWIYFNIITNILKQIELLRHIGEGLCFLFPIIINTFYPFYMIFSKSAYEGSQTSVHCAVSDEALDNVGHYFSDCQPKKPHANALNREYATKLWKLSEQMVGLQ